MELTIGDNYEAMARCYAKLLLNSYYGIHSFKDKKPDGCQCEKSIGRGYGFNHGMINIDEFDIIKEMQKMKKSTNKPVVNPIKKVIFNPPATIVFWEKWF